jgi:hypothetical protein
MGWASKYIASLKYGNTAKFRPRGHSMTGRVEDGQLVTVEPVDPMTLKVGDVVLCKVDGREYLHLVKAVQGPRVLIGNNRGGTNGWTSRGNVFGILTKVEA